MLKDLKKEAKYRYIASGSLLSATLKHIFIPMGSIDFIINDYDKLNILPIEIKSGKNQNNYRAIPKLVDKNGNYKLSLGYVFRNKNIISTNDDIVTMPIYLIMFV